MTHDSTDDGSGNGLSKRATDVTYTIDEDERPSVAVVLAVASLTNTPVLELDPLYDVVDPEQLDTVVSDADGDFEAGPVTFDFGGCRVSVTGDEVRVRERDSDGG